MRLTPRRCTDIADISVVAADLSDEEQRRAAAGVALEAGRVAILIKGAALHTRFNQSFAGGALITPVQSAAALIVGLDGDDSGSIWDVSDATALA